MASTVEEAGRYEHPVKILAHVHQAPPLHNAGSEMMMLTILRGLASAGHDCRLITDRGVACELHGVPITLAGPSTPNRHDVKKAAHRWADIVLTHLSATYDATKHARLAKRPLVHLVHNDWTLKGFRVTPKTCQLAVLNSEWLTRAIGWPAAQMIVRPPVVVADYETEPGGAVTLVNLSAKKGADTFYALAERRPDLEFLGVVGGHSTQDIRDVPNVEIVEHTDDMRAVYARTGVVLMPSEYESWGRVAIEAACSGIPTIAHPTPGLLESLGTTGTFADRESIADWDTALADLIAGDTPPGIRERALSLEQQAAADIAGLSSALETL